MAHEKLHPKGRAGLIGTSGVRVGNSRVASLDYIVDNGGTIHNAVSEREWPGEAVVFVSFVNWTKSPIDQARTLMVDGRVYAVPSIPSHLQLHADVRRSNNLAANHGGCSTGVNFGTKAFFLDSLTATRLATDDKSRPFIKAVATGNKLLGGKSPDFVVDMSVCQSEEHATAGGMAFEHIREHAYPTVQSKGAGDASWKKRWWQARRPYASFFSALGQSARLLACSRHAARSIFFFLSRDFTPTESLQVFRFVDDYSFGILQSMPHWEWTCVKGTKLKGDFRYTMDVWATFPWPQEPSVENVAAVAHAARDLRATRRQLMTENAWSLRELYQAAEVAGPHPLKTAQTTLDRTVEGAYGKPTDQEATEFLLEMNLNLAEDEEAGEKIQGPGLPAGLDPRDPRWFSTDCIEPPPLPVTDDADPEAADG